MANEDNDICSILSRRRLIELIGGGSITGLAGCSTKEDTQPDVNESPGSKPASEISMTSTQTTHPTANTDTAQENLKAEFEYESSIPDELRAGELVQISIKIKNTGNSTESHSVQLLVGGSTVGSETVTLEPNTSTTVEFSFRTFDIGNHEVVLNDESLGRTTIHPFGTPVENRPITRKLGATHTNSKYRFDDGDLLNEGAEVLQNLGLRTFKGWMHRPDVQYPWTKWPEFDSMVDIVSHPHFQELFERPFDTYVFVADARTETREELGGGYFRRTMSSWAEQEEEEAFYELAKYLLETYDGDGKEFLFQNWEGDWLLAGGTGDVSPPNSSVLERGKRWWNARQRGIVRAREEVTSDCAVFGVCEINNVRAAIEKNERWIVNTILPELEVDLVSYSAWDLSGYVRSHKVLTQEVREHIHDTLDFVQEQAPERTDYVDATLGPESKQVFIGEFGAPMPENPVDNAMRGVRGIAEESIAWGTPYCLFWQTYDNEVYIDGEKVIVDPDIEQTLEEAFGGYAGMEDVRGFYLIRPDGSRSPVWYYFADLLDAHQDKFARIDIQYDSVRLESEVNPNISEENARKLAVGCDVIEVEVGGQTGRFDIGSWGDEVAFLKGIHGREETEQFDFRWFGGGEKATTFYVPYEREGLTGELEAIRFDAWGVEGGVDADILLGGDEIGEIYFDDSRSKYSVMV